MLAQEPSAKRWPRVAWAVLAFAVLTGVLLATALGVLRAEAMRAGYDRAASLSHLVAEQMSRSLEGVDARLQLAAGRLEAMEAGGRPDAAAVRAMLRAHLGELPVVRAIWVLDAGGRVVFDSATGDLGAMPADRPHLRIHRQAPETGFFVGPPARGHDTGRWQLTASRPLRAAGGTLRGVIVAAIEPSHFEHLWSRDHIGATGVVTLYGRDGQPMMRSPAVERLPGRDFSAAPFTWPADAASGVMAMRGGVDGVQRIVAYHALPGHPQLLATVGIAYGEVLASWRRFALLASAFWAGSLLIAAGLTVQLHRQGRIRQRTERRFRELAQAMPQIVFISDARGEVQFISRRWVDVTGAGIEEALGARWQGRLHPDDRVATLEHVTSVLATGQEVQHEARLRYRDGNYRWQLLRAVPIRDDGGEIGCWYGTATDIDALKQAQGRLVSQAEFLRMAGRLARMGGWRLDLATERVTWSDEAAAILELPSTAQPTIQEILAMLVPASLAHTQRALRDCAEHGTPFDVEVEAITRGGCAVWLRSLGQPVRDAEGRLVAIQGAQQDITARVRMVEEIRRLNASLEDKVAERTRQLAQQEALFRTLAEQAPLPFWTVDPSGAATFFSRAWYQLVGGTPPQWLGYAWMDLLHPDDEELVRESWSRSRGAGTVYAGTRRLRARDGTYHSTIYRAEPVRDTGGNIVFWVGIDTDVTDILQSETALRLANAQLGAFSYSVSHDLQSPLQRVLSFTRLLQEELKGLPAGRAQHYLSRIRSNAETMAQLIEGLLVLAQVSEVDVVRGTVNLSDMAAEILQRLQQDQPQRRVRCAVQPGLAVQGDARLMRSVLENLIGNAWKFSAGKEDAEIVVGGSAQRGEYFVRDNGAGFDMAYADRLFGTFQRLHDAEQFPGTGIGLATVARAISRQGGRIWAEAAPGEGATFYFTLPVA